MPTEPGEHMFRHSLERGELLKDRDSFLSQAAAGLRVVHVGCVDWPLSEQRLATGDLLHSKLLASAEQVLGLDIDQDGMATLARVLGGSYLNVD